MAEKLAIMTFYNSLSNDNVMGVTGSDEPECAAPYNFMELYSELQLIFELSSCNFTVWFTL